MIGSLVIAEGDYGGEGRVRLQELQHYLRPPSLRGGGICFLTGY